MVTVYLDTHHVSRIASERNDASRFFSNSNFSFVFSLSHIVESLPKEPRENPASIKRLNIIMGPSAKGLVGWGKVAEFEKSNRSIDLSDLVCDKGQMLFDDFRISRHELTKKACEGLKEILRERFPDLDARRPIQAKLLKRGKMTPAAFKFIRERLQQTSEQLTADMPQALPLLGEGGLYDFLEGKVSEKIFKRNFMEAMANPVALAEMSSMPDLASILDLSRFFWNQMEELAEMLSRFVIGVRSDFTKPGAPKYGQGRQQIELHLKEDEFRIALVRRFAGVEVSADALASMPGTRLFVDVFSQYMLEKLDQYANSASGDFGAEPKFKRSDAADFSHVFYYPYVSVFGCDGAMANRIEKAGWPTQKVVTTDSELKSMLIEFERH